MAKSLIASLLVLLAMSMPGSAKRHSHSHSHSHSRSHSTKAKSTGHISKGCSTQRLRRADPCAKPKKP